MDSQTMTIENAFVAYFDILGFRARSGSDDFTRKYEAVIKTVGRIRDTGLSIFLLSDTIIMVSEDFEQVKKHSRDFYTWGVLNDFWVRGGIARGSITRYKEVTEQDKIIFPFLGEGYLKAYKLETALNMSGISLDEEFFTGEIPFAGLEPGTDYVEYEEYLPKRGYEGKKWLLLPWERSLERIVDGMHFEEMLKSHVEDLDKYINTFCFYVSFMLKNADALTLSTFRQKLLSELELHGRKVLIPAKVTVIFIAVIEGLVDRYRYDRSGSYSSPAVLEEDISSILAALKEQGHLSAFIDHLLDYDKRRRTNLYKDINGIRAGL